MGIVKELLLCVGHSHLLMHSILCIILIPVEGLWEVVWCDWWVFSHEPFQTLRELLQ